ncbi:uncharacterized protein FA14DRAFT_82225 [Meira miltonrushii]|uniref:PX domain-containing protein n=1 Tax=Meira miltonrushii TaxID=1280837 RepID=A0A316V2Y7_9BASI|nr:uncharacterized protein FA14DRAFT_82225 [Meira miltonrushii]PWN31890.1 hypothetical protein FA14DRAFT_82225 [Meira miltonrushii]
MMASSSTSTMNVLSERNLNSIALQSNSTFKSTFKPVPPPKPNHLSTAFTGTLNSDALKSYIKQQTQRQSIASTSTTQRHSRKNNLTSSQYAHDTFRTSRESSTDDDEEDENAAWGTARQTPSPIPGKPGLVDIFAPLTIPGSDSMNLDAKSSFTIRQDPIGRSQRDTIQPSMNEVETPTKTRRSPSSSTDTYEDDKQVATIKPGKNETLGFMLSDGEQIDPQGTHLREDSSNTARQPSMICSSEEGTIRSREPSILSRLSTFEDDFDEDDVHSPGNGSGSQGSHGIEHESTPRKNWMHARDGSAFERASPCSGSKGGLSRILGEKSKINVSKTSIKESEEADTKTGLPLQSRGLPMLVAGPPPIRPKSVVLKVSDIEEGQAEATEKEEVASIATPTQEKSQAACELRVPDTAFSSTVQPVSELNVAQPNVSKSNLSSRRREVERGTGRQARALYEFEGEPRFNELSLAPGQVFEILKEDVQDGWSLAAAEQKNVWTKGLIPQGWYTYIQEFTVSPNVAPTSTQTAEGSSTSLVVPMIRSHSSISATSNSGNRDESQNIRSRQDLSRPASGVGQMSSSFAESKGALQLLTQMKQQTGTVTPHPQSGFRAVSGSRIQAPIREASVEEVRPESMDLTSNDSNMSGVSNSVSEPSLTANDANVGADTSMETNVSTETASSSWKPPGIFGGRSLNRFAPFVTSGVEGYILSDPSAKKAIEPATEDKEQQFAISYGYHGGPAWKCDGVSLIVEVHSPEVHVDDLGKEYTAYVVHTSFVLASEEQAEVQDLLLDPFKRPEEPSMTSSVYRRFNQFRWLANHLCKYYPSIMLTFPPMPSTNQGAGRLARFDEIFVERRRRHLQSWLSCVVRHPSLSKDAGVRFFLEAEEEGEEWLQAAKEMVQKENQMFRYDQLTPASHIFTSTSHPMFNFEANEAELEAKQMTKFSEMYERCMSNVNEGSGVLNTYKGFRSTTTKSSESYRQLSLSILRLITGSDAGDSSSHSSNANGSMIKSPSRMLNQGFLPPMGNVGKRGPSGATNEDRAWCWREGCQECRRLTSAMQITAEAFQVVANDYQSHAEGSLFDVHDRMHNLAKAHQQQQPLIEVHRNALAMYRAATGEKASEDAHQATQDTKAKRASNEEPHLHSKVAEGMAIRSETVLNVTLSEMDRIHAQRVQDWNALSREMLDEQIAFYKDILHHLQTARSKVGDALGTPSSRSANHTASNSQTSNESSISTSASQARGPLLPSPYEVQLAHPIVMPALEMPCMQLTEPSAASKAIRPVALAGEVLSDWLGGSSASRIL